MAGNARFKGGACNYFHYDALMRRSAVEEGTGATYYAWDKDALAPVLARTPSIGAEESFVRGRAPVPGAGDLAARVRKEGGQAHVRYDIFDHQGNVHLVVDESGEPVAQRAFNAWGEAIAQTGGSEAKRRGQCSPAWRGLPDDPESRYWLTPTRVYDAKAGRFLSRDPLGFVDGMGLYLAYFVPGAYDPLGLQRQDYESVAVVRATPTFPRGCNPRPLAVWRPVGKTPPTPPLCRPFRSPTNRPGACPVAGAWASLPAHIKAAVLALVDSAQGGAT